MSTTFAGRFIERGTADYEAARTEALFNARHPFAMSRLQRLRDVYDAQRTLFDFYQRSGCAANEFEPR
ncbi:MAG: hypothetical protein ABI862_02805 [Ilumatobacteraceae bacterium]